jgi:hypothetical protein
MIYAHKITSFGMRAIGSKFLSSSQLAKTGGIVMRLKHQLTALAVTLTTFMSYGLIPAMAQTVEPKASAANLIKGLHIVIDGQKNWRKCVQWLFSWTGLLNFLLNLYLETNTGAVS